MNKPQALKIRHGKNVNNRVFCAKTKNPSNCHSRKHTSKRQNEQMRRNQ